MAFNSLYRPKTLDEGYLTELQDLSRGKPQVAKTDDILSFEPSWNQTLADPISLPVQDVFDRLDGKSAKRMLRNLDGKGEVLLPQDIDTAIANLLDTMAQNGSLYTQEDLKRKILSRLGYREPTYKIGRGGIGGIYPRKVQISEINDLRQAVLREQGKLDEQVPGYSNKQMLEKSWHTIKGQPELQPAPSLSVGIATGKRQGYNPYLGNPNKGQGVLSTKMNRLGQSTISQQTMPYESDRRQGFSYVPLVRPPEPRKTVDLGLQPVNDTQWKQVSDTVSELGDAAKSKADEVSKLLLERQFGTIKDVNGNDIQVNSTLEYVKEAVNQKLNGALVGALTYVGRLAGGGVALSIINNQNLAVAGALTVGASIIAAVVTLYQNQIIKAADDTVEKEVAVSDDTDSQVSLINRFVEAAYANIASVGSYVGELLRKAGDMAFGDVREASAKLQHEAYQAVKHASEDALKGLNSPKDIVDVKMPKINSSYQINNASVSEYVKYLQTVIQRIDERVAYLDTFDPDDRKFDIVADGLKQSVYTADKEFQRLVEYADRFSPDLAMALKAYRVAIFNMVKSAIFRKDPVEPRSAKYPITWEIKNRAAEVKRTGDKLYRVLGDELINNGEMMKIIIEQMV